MAKFIKGDVVVIPFPFSDLSGSKRRPALVLADLPGSDIILCQITSQAKKDKFVVAISNNDFTTGALPVQSYVRPNRIFTADKNIIIRKAGSLTTTVTKKIIQQVVSIFTN
jgi:mRNA interferase MazF